MDRPTKNTNHQEHTNDAYEIRVDGRFSLWCGTFGEAYGTAQGQSYPWTIDRHHHGTTERVLEYGQ